MMIYAHGKIGANALISKLIIYLGVKDNLALSSN